jgi:hypothetical protein
MCSLFFYVARMKGSFYQRGEIQAKNLRLLVSFAVTFYILLWRYVNVFKKEFCIYAKSAVYLILELNTLVLHLLSVKPASDFFQHPALFRLLHSPDWVELARSFIYRISYTLYFRYVVTMPQGEMLKQFFNINWRDILGKCNSCVLINLLFCWQELAAGSYMIHCSAVHILISCLFKIAFHTMF